MAKAAPAEDAKDEPKDSARTSACLAAPKGTPPTGENWFYRVERGTKRHCWYTRAAGSRRIAETVPQAAPPPQQMAAPPAPPPPLQDSIANARAEADISATAAITPPRPTPAPETPNWKLAERWSEHQNGGAPFEARPAAAPAVVPRAAPIEISPSETDDVSVQNMFEIAGGAFGFAALATILVMIFARRQKREVASDFALFATTNDPKRRRFDRPVAERPQAPMRPQPEDNETPPMRPFTLRNLRAANPD